MDLLMPWADPHAPEARALAGLEPLEPAAPKPQEAAAPAQAAPPKEAAAPAPAAPAPPHLPPAITVPAPDKAQLQAMPPEAQATVMVSGACACGGEQAV